MCQGHNYLAFIGIFFYVHVIDFKIGGDELKGLVTNIEAFKCQECQFSDFSLISDFFKRRGTGITLIKFVKCTQIVVKGLLFHL